jgi:hypothetical protein
VSQTDGGANIIPSFSKLYPLSFHSHNFQDTTNTIRLCFFILYQTNSSSFKPTFGPRMLGTCSIHIVLHQFVLFIGDHHNARSKFKTYKFLYINVDYTLSYIVHHHGLQCHTMSLPWTFSSCLKNSLNGHQARLASAI